MKLQLILIAGQLWSEVLSAGVVENFPDIFPKGCEAGDGWAQLTGLPKLPDDDKNLLPRIAADDTEWLGKLDSKKTGSLVERNKPLLEELERAMARGTLHSDTWNTYELTGKDLSLIMPALQGMRVIMMRDALAARDGDNPRQGTETALRCAAFALRACEAEPPMLDGLIASAAVLLATHHATGLASLPKMTPDILRDTAAELEQLDRRAGEAMKGIVTGEARWSLKLGGQLIESTTKRRELVLEMAVWKQLSSEQKGIVPVTEKATPQETDSEAVRRVWKTKMPESVSEALLAAEKVDWHAYLRMNADWFRALKNAETRSVAAFRASFHPPDKNEPLKGTALEPLFGKSDYPTDESYLRICARTSCYLRLARVGILLRLYELKHGKLPASLDDLAPEFCASLPVDPFDGKAIRYDWLSGSLWCVGMNLKDEGGGNDPRKADGPDDEMLKLP